MLCGSIACLLTRPQVMFDGSASGIKLSNVGRRGHDRCVIRARVSWQALGSSTALRREWIPLARHSWWTLNYSRSGNGPPGCIPLLWVEGLARVGRRVRLFGDV